MAGKIVDLGTPSSWIPSPVTLDSNIVIARWLASYESPHTQNADRAVWLFRRLRSTGTQTFLTPTGYSEVLHAAVRSIYQEARQTYQAALRAHFRRMGGFSWLDLYKLNPTILQEQQDQIGSLRNLLTLEDIAVLDEYDFAVPEESQRIDHALPEVMVRYGLDSNDAMIIFEAARAGLRSIVSFDRDMRRAAADFDVYTWLDDD